MTDFYLPKSVDSAVGKPTAHESGLRVFTYDTNRHVLQLRSCSTKQHRLVSISLNDEQIRDLGMYLLKLSGATSLDDIDQLQEHMGLTAGVATK